MLIELAYKACILCHRYNQELQRNLIDGVDKIHPDNVGAIIRVIGYSFLRDQANFEVLKALDNNELSKKCAGCDCSKPIIADSLEDNLFVSLP